MLILITLYLLIFFVLFFRAMRDLVKSGSPFPQRLRIIFNAFLIFVGILALFGDGHIAWQTDSGGQFSFTCPAYLFIGIPIINMINIFFSGRLGRLIKKSLHILSFAGNAFYILVGLVSILVVPTLVAGKFSVVTIAMMISGFFFLVTGTLNFCISRGEKQKNA